MEAPAVIDVRKGQTSASRATRDFECPGSFLTERALPDPPSNNDTDLGRKVHNALADSGDVKLLGSFSSKERELFDSCRAIEKAVVLNWFGPFHPPMRVYRHERYWLKFFHPVTKEPFEHSGEADAVFVSGAKALIVDYKTLAGEVADASMNLQLRDLACLLRGHLMNHPKEPQPLVECATVIIQPYVSHTPEVCRYTEPDMDKAAQEMMARIVASHNSQSQRKAGAHCKFCKAAYWSKCLEHQTWASATLPTFRDLIALTPDKWTPDQRAVFMDRLPVAEQWLKDTKAAMEAGAIADPDFVPGYAMQDGVVRTPITDLKTLLDRIVAHGGTAAALLTEAGDVTKKDLEAYFKRLVKNKIKGNVAQNKAYEELLQGITTAKPNKPTLKKV